MLEHFAFFDNLAFFTYMHCSSLHKGGTLFYCCLAKRPLFFFFFLLYLINLAVLLRATSLSASQKAGSLTWPGV